MCAARLVASRFHPGHLGAYLLRQPGKRATLDDLDVAIAPHLHLGGGGGGGGGASPPRRSGEKSTGKAVLRALLSAWPRLFNTGASQKKAEKSSGVTLVTCCNALREAASDVAGGFLFGGAPSTWRVPGGSTASWRARNGAGDRIFEAAVARLRPGGAHRAARKRGREDEGGRGGDTPPRPACRLGVGARGAAVSSRTFDT